MYSYRTKRVLVKCTRTSSSLFYFTFVGLLLGSILAYIEFHRIIANDHSISTHLRTPLRWLVRFASSNSSSSSKRPFGGVISPVVTISTRNTTISFINKPWQQLDKHARRPWHYKTFDAAGRQRAPESAITPSHAWFLTDAIQLDPTLAALRPLQIDTENELRAMIIATPMPQRFFFFWISQWTTWGATHDLFLQSLFAHHPDASVFCLYTMPYNDITVHPLQRYTSAGYKIHLFYFSGMANYAKTWGTSDDTRAWISQPQTTYTSHVTDYLRFYLLYEYGGTYVDTDAIFFRAFPLKESFIGLDVLEDSASRPLIWLAYPQQRLYLAPGMMRAEKGAPFLRAALEFGFDHEDYDPMCYNCVGPYALNCIFFEPDAQQMCLYSNEVFYPFGYITAHRLFNSTEPFIPMLYESLRRRTIALHLFGKMTSLTSIGKNSVMDIAEQAFSIFPVAQGAVCTMGGQLGAATLVVLGESTVFRDVNLVYFQDCAAFHTGESMTVRVEVKSGSLTSTTIAATELSSYTVLSEVVKSIGEANRFLATLTYHAPHSIATFDSAIFSLSQVRGGTLPAISFEARLLLFNRLVTVISHTHGRLELSKNMYESVQQWYPGTPVIISDDSDDFTLSGLNALKLTVLRLPADSGLSAARNSLIRKATTNFVFLIDDDFSVLQSSHLDVLLKKLLAHDFDIAAATIPADEKLYGMSFRGLINVTNGVLALQPGDKGIRGGCLHVEFTPNVFMARRGALAKIGWDEDLKLGEHEEFFYRAKIEGLKILSCPYAEVKHNQSLWWKENSNIDEKYVKSRRRVFDFLRMALKKHNFKRLVSFGSEVVSL